VDFAQRSFLSRASSVAAARAFVAEALVPSTDAVNHWAELVTSELTTNAVAHAGSEFEVGVQLNGEVVISVSDRSRAQPVQPAVAPPVGATSGRGMMLIQATSDRWGVESVADGKRVWCALRRQPAA
jgi:anti-sigma regulatory factor (Ser/Thr protein kinase)